MKVDLDAGASGEKGRATANVIEGSEGATQDEGQRAVSDRMESLGAVAGAVVEEINAPLGYTVANIGYALEALARLDVELTVDEADSADDAAARIARARATMFTIADALREARQGGDRLRLLVRDLKMFGDTADDRVGPIDIRRVLESAINLAFVEIRPRAQLIKDYGVSPLVVGNEARLGQLFLNLLRNAAEAIPEGGAEHHRIRVVSGTDARGWCRVEIVDTGRGFAPADLPRVFDPFFTTKDTGTGLGLSICHQIVSAMGGEITVENEPHEGARVCVSLPSAGDSAVVPVSAPVGNAARGPRRCVLVIDDEPLMARAVQRLLEAEHDVVMANDPREATALILNGARYDAVLCDLMMPGMSGMEVYEAIARVAPEQARRIVFMTGGAFTSRTKSFLDSLENPRVEKPLEYAALRAILRGQLADPIER